MRLPRPSRRPHRGPAALRLAGLLAVVLGASVGLAGCGGGDAPAAKVKVAAAFTPLQELATQIGGDRVEVTNLTPIGGQPHDLVPAAPALSALKQAKVVLYLGGTFQPAVVEAVGTLPASTTKVDLASDGALDPPKPLRGTSGPVEGASTGQGPDPHLWLDPERFAQMAEQTQTALVAADPEAKADLSARGARYRAELATLAADYQRALAGCRGGVILTTHPAWGYLADRYGLDQTLVAGVIPGATVAPRTLSALAAYAKRKKITTLFTTVALPSRQASQIKRATGLTVIPLNPLEGLSQEQRDQGAGYVSVMRDNLKRLTAGLGCEASPVDATTPATTTPPGGTTPAQ